MVFNYFLILVILLLFAGLGVDAGMLEWRYMQMSFAAKAAATSGALALQRGGSSAVITSAAQTTASLNGFTNGSNGTTVLLQNPPSAGTYAGNTYSTRCVITQQVTTAFMALAGFSTVSMTAEYDMAGAAPVSLSSAFNIYAIFKDASSVTNGGFDTASYALSANALGLVRANSNLGALLSWRGNLFFLGPPSGMNGASQVTLSLTQAKFSQLLMLASTAYGPVTASFVVTYTDGSTATTSLQMSDWCNYLNISTNEVEVAQSPYRLYNTTGPNGNSTYIYGYTINLTNSKTIKSLTLPSVRNVVVLAVDLVP